MAACFTRETEGIYRLQFPFESVLTSVFLIEEKEHYTLVDAGASGEDVEHYLLPALTERGLSLDAIGALVLTHRHRDHAGGATRIKELCPRLTVITEANVTRGALSTYPLPGHTEEMIGLLDLRSNTLITGDGLQGEGVGKYRCSLRDKGAYEDTLDRLASDGRIENLLFSHAYEPWCTASVFGRREVLRVLNDCRIAAERIYGKETI